MLTNPERDTRRCIVDTAERFFRQIGYQKTTVADIAKSLRMSPANVYRFFESKKAINEAVAERLMGEVEAAVAAIAAQDRPVVDRLRDMMRATNRLNSELYVGQQKMHEMVEVAMSESWNVVRGHIERFDAIFRGVIAQGIANGELAPADPVRATHCAKTAIMRFCHPMLIAQCADLPGPTMDDQIDFILAALRYRPPPA